jgi:hypothetical protein
LDASVKHIRKLIEKHEQLNEAKQQQKTIEKSDDPVLMDRIAQLAAQVKHFTEMNQLQQERLLLEVEKRLHELKLEDIPEFVAAKAENSRVEAKTKIAEAKAKTKMNYRLAQAEENTQQYLDIGNRLKSQRRNIAIMQHLKTNDIQAYLEGSKENFNEIWRDDEKVTELETKYESKQANTYEDQQEMKFISQRKPRNKKSYQDFMEIFFIKME